MAYGLTPFDGGQSVKNGLKTALINFLSKKGEKRAGRRRMSTTITYLQLLGNQEIQVQLGNLSKTPRSGSP